MAAMRGLDEYSVTTVYTDMTPEKQKDPNSVKMITNEYIAHWFCRASLEYGVHHLGIYGYRKNIGSLYLESDIYEEENIEKLEQLRWIQNGVNIGVNYVNESCIEINTPEDLAKWKLLH